MIVTYPSGRFHVAANTEERRTTERTTVGGIAERFVILIDRLRGINGMKINVVIVASSIIPSVALVFVRYASGISIPIIPVPMGEPAAVAVNMCPVAIVGGG